MCGMFSVSTLAANESSMITTVSYTQETPAGYYEVGIPSSILLNENNFIYFTVKNVNIADNQSILISIDSSKTFESDGKFYLSNEYGAKMTANISRMDRKGGPVELINGLTNPVVATFVNGDTMPTSYGTLSIFPNNNADTQPGNYTGYIHFKIGLVNN